MRYCPTCKTEYDDDIIRFCTKDGSALVEDKQPTFTENLPSESMSDDSDDIGEETIIRRKAPVVPAPPEPTDDPEPEAEKDSSRIVIDTSEKAKAAPAPSSGARRSAPPPPPQQTNVGLIVFFSVLGTLAVSIGLFAIYLMLTSGPAMDPNSNLNVNENINANENENLNENIDLNSLLNENLDLNSNANMDTPTPTPSPSPSPSVSPDANVNSNLPNTNTAVPSPSVQTPTPRPTVTTPTATPSVPSNTNNTVNLGTINNRAVSLPLPAYPAAARDARATGRVLVRVVMDEAGRVLSAQAISGHPTLRAPAEAAAMRSTFRPATLQGQSVKATGTIRYNFVQ